MAVKQQTTETENDGEQRRFETESPEDVVEILRRASRFVDSLHRPGNIPEELDEAADYVEEEMLDA